jgi:SAM-dependent methyltransferase
MKTGVCRSCGASQFAPVLDLGMTPLANSLLTAEQLESTEPRFPLNVVRCTACSLVQLDTTVPPEAMFGNYVYFSSFSSTMLEHAKRLVDQLIVERQLTEQSRVIEVASNDGYLLQYYKSRGIEVLGIEPAENIAHVARDERGIPTLNEFFGQALADQLAAEGKLADVIHAHNVLAHVPDINGFVSGLKTILKPDGVIVIEVPYLKNLLDDLEFDTIYHEHIFYFSLTALDQLFTHSRLRIFDVVRVPIHGGSLRIFASHEGTFQRRHSVTELLAEELKWGVSEPEPYQSFAKQVGHLKSQLLDVLRNLKAQGKRIVVYGASAKGSTLLNTFEITHDLIDFVVDRSTVKQDLFTPGTHFHIKSPVSLLETQPDYVLLLTWNFADEILEQQAEYIARGGKFIIPLPEVRIIPA